MSEVEKLLPFLMGAEAIDGVWFGEKHPGREGRFWWRADLRAAIAADKQAQPSGEMEALREIADIAAGSRTVNSLPHIERIARAALTAASKGEKP